MIAPDAKPIDNRNPYKRIDLAAKPKRKEENHPTVCSHCGTPYHEPYGCHHCNLYGG